MQRAVSPDQTFLLHAAKSGKQVCYAELTVIGLMPDPRPDELQKGFLKALNLVAI